MCGSTQGKRTVLSGNTVHGRYVLKHSLTYYLYLNGELCLLTSQSGPDIDLHRARSSPFKQYCQKGTAGRSSQFLAQLSKKCGHVMMDAHNALLAFSLLPKGRDYNDPQEPARDTR